MPDCMNSALAHKKWSFETPPEPVPQEEIKETFEADVIVIGAGTSGLITANSAMDSGLDVILFSASSKPIARGGSNCASYSRALERAGYGKMDPWYVQKEILANYNCVDQKKWYKWYNNSEEAFNWVIDIMETRGYYTALEQTNHIKEGSLYHSPLASHSWVPANNDGTVHTSGNQKDLVKEFANRLVAGGGRLFYRNAGYQLVKNDKGRVIGVIARRMEDSGYNKFIGRKAVVIAAGDFSADKEMMSKYAPEYVKGVRDAVYETEQDYNVISGFNGTGLYRGDMIKAALWAGAAWQKNLPNCPMIMNMSGGPIVNRYQNFFGLLLDVDGERFMNEYASRAPGPMTQLLQKKNTTFAIWDSDWINCFKWYDGWRPAQAQEETVRSKEEVLDTWKKNVEAGKYLMADTLEELMEKAGMPKKALETIGHYNEMCDKGEDTEFYKDPDMLIPVKKGPFYCQKTDQSNMSLYTILGGLRTNINMQVCDENDDPIPGLYVVGTAVGDVFAGRYTFMMQGAVYGMCCITFGYLTGKYIAEQE